MIIICFVYVRSCLPLRAVRELERMRKHKATNTWFPLNVIMPTFEEKTPPPDWKTSALFHLLSLYTRTCDGAMIASGYIRALNLSPNTEIAQQKTYPSQLILLIGSVNLYRSLSALCLKNCECKKKKFKKIKK